MPWKAGEARVRITADDRQFQQASKQVQTTMGRMGTRMRQVSAAVRSSFRYLFFGGGAIGAIAIRNYMKQEEVLMRLRNALRASGTEAEKHYDRLKEFSSEMQKATIYGDEFVQELMSEALMLGANAEEMEKVIHMTLGLTSILGNAKTAVRYVVLAMQGEYTMLQRYIPTLRAAKNEQEKMEAIMEAVGRGWEDLAARTESSSGRMRQAMNRLGDQSEAAGKRVLQVLDYLIERLERLSVLWKWREWIKEDMVDAFAAGREEFMKYRTELLRFVEEQARISPGRKILSTVLGKPGFYKTYLTPELEKAFKETRYGKRLWEDVLNARKKAAHEAHAAEAKATEEARKAAEAKKAEVTGAEEVVEKLEKQIELERDRAAAAKRAVRAQFVGLQEMWGRIQTAMAVPSAEAGYQKRMIKATETSAQRLDSLNRLLKEANANLSAIRRGGMNGNQTAVFGE